MLRQSVTVMSTVDKPINNLVCQHLRKKAERLMTDSLKFHNLQ